MGSLAVLRLDQLHLVAGRSLLRVAANAYLTRHYTSVSRLRRPSLLLIACAAWHPLASELHAYASGHASSVLQRPLAFSVCLFVHISLVSAGVMGGVTSMNGFLNNYFPSVLEKQNTVNTVGNLYCQYDSQTLQLMTSVLFISGAICELTGTTGIVVLLPS